MSETGWAVLGSRILTYWHTLRYLRPAQIYGRIWCHLNKPNPDSRPAPPLREKRGAWLPCIAHPAVLEGPKTFRLLNALGTIDRAGDWNGAQQAKLWLYNLHYFGDLNAEAAGTRQGWHRALIARWIAENPPGHGNGWEPYPLSLRIVNWIKWALAGNPLEPDWHHSLAVQTRYLRGSLEWHLLGNHLLANAKAMVFAGSFFAGAEADRWRTTGLKILAREIPEQILPDGGHFELSPMYHVIVLEDVLDLVNLAATYPDAMSSPMARQLRATGRAMLRWIAAMQHPDGKIPFFNDSAFGIAPKFAQLDRYAQCLGLGSAPTPADGVTHLEASGYIRVQWPDVVALLDVGRVGPDYLPGHAHADTLSFELSLFGARFILNSGTSVYAEGHERARQRGTAAHSTLTLDDEDSSQVWGAFRVARRARPVGLKISETRDCIAIACGHDGYRRLAMPATHYRSWAFEDCRVTVEDTIEGTPRRAVARFHLAPDVGVRMHNTHAELTLGSGRTATCRIEGGTLKAGPGTWHPEFGSAIPTTVLLAEFRGPRCRATFTW